MTGMYQTSVTYYKKLTLAMSTGARSFYMVFSTRLMFFYFYCRYGGGPAVNHLYVCHTCQIESERIEKRRKNELEMFIRVKK